MFKQLSLTFVLILLTSTISFAKTAHVEYSFDFTSMPNSSVAILVSESPNFVETLKSGDNVHGVMDVDHVGFVDVGNIEAGKTYYFSAVAWDQNGNMSGFSPTLEKSIPAFNGFNLTPLPDIKINASTITFTIKISGE